MGAGGVGASLAAGSVVLWQGVLDKIVIPMVVSFSPSSKRLASSTPCISVWSVLETSYFHIPKRPRL